MAESLHLCHRFVACLGSSAEIGGLSAASRGGQCAAAAMNSSSRPADSVDDLLALPNDAWPAPS